MEHKRQVGSDRKRVLYYEGYEEKWCRGDTYVKESEIVRTEGYTDPLRRMSRRPGVEVVKKKKVPSEKSRETVPGYRDHI